MLQLQCLLGLLFGDGNNRRREVDGASAGSSIIVIHVIYL